MHQKLQRAFAHEMAEARCHLEAGELAHAFAHAERAHVLGQSYVLPHVQAHWLMLRIGLAQREGGVVVGQLVRVILGAIGSAVGIVPIGNMGGGNISMFKRLPIDPALSKIIRGD